MRRLEGIVSMDGRLKGRERRDRRLLFICAVVSSIVIGYAAVTRPSKSMTALVIAHDIIFLGTMSLIIVQCLCRIYITKRAVQVHVVLWTISICLVHLHNQAVSLTPRWSLFVMVLDLALVMRLGGRFATCLMGGVLAWIAVLHAEVQFRFGLLDLPGSSSRAYRIERLADRCDCSNPPCSNGVPYMLVDILTFSLMIGIDFLATRGFAEEAEKEQAVMASTIETVEAAAQLLAGYDVDTVAELLEAAEGRLPPAMYAALRRLEQNLRAYRPYLPAALFERAVGDEEYRSAHVAVPGMESEEATLVFTDIRASTSVWEEAPEAMQKAILIHNTAMRRVIAMFGGYEVKTIGDSFMVAFDGPCAGVCFGLAVQEALLAAEWPAALLEVPICSPTELWGGLTVRVGVNHGPVVAETNTLTGRVDYLGHTVNVASRLESTCVPGAVAVPSAVWSQVSGACASAVCGEEAAIELKGVSALVPVRYVWPAALADRQHHPLPQVRSNSPSGMMSTTSLSFRGRRSVNPAVIMVEKHATTGSLSMKTATDVLSACGISDCLEAVMPLMRQSRGTLVTLLGENLFMGWNLVQHVPMHAENAVQFMKRVFRLPLGEHLAAGLASGTLYHGDVGTHSQRFVTIAGPCVSAALQVRRTVHDLGMRFLYSPGEDTALVGALHALLQVSTLVQPKSDAPGIVGQLYELSSD